MLNKTYFAILFLLILSISLLFNMNMDSSFAKVTPYPGNACLNYDTNFPEAGAIACYDMSGDKICCNPGGTQNTPSTSSANSESDWNKIGIELADQEKYEEAINAYDKALKYNPNSKAVLYNKILALQQLNEYEEAFAISEKLIQLDPNDADYWYQNGYMYYKLKNNEEALKSFKRTLELDPNSKRTYYMMGEIMQNQNDYRDYEQAIVYYEKALEIDPDYKHAQYSLERAERKNEGGGCLIATATYGSELAPQVQQLRELRDNSLLQTESGTNFMGIFNDVYYSFSPVISDYERENPIFKEMVKVTITPMITSLSLLHYVDMDSEEQVLGYGISLILLNIGMYVGIPAVAVIGIRRI